MQFDTTHEYYFNDGDVHYCADHDGLIIAEYNRNTGNNRLLVEGIGADEILAFAKSVFKGYQPAFLAVKDVEKRDKIVKEIYEEIGKYLNVEKEVNKATKSRKTTKKDPVDAAYSA